MIKPKSINEKPSKPYEKTEENNQKTYLETKISNFWLDWTLLL